MLGCDCHPRHNHGSLGWDRFLLADGFELCFSLPASPLIISFCFFPMTDESVRGEKNQRNKFCPVSAAEPPLACTSLLQIYTRGLELRGEYSSVVWPVVCTKGTKQSSLQKVCQSAMIFTTDNSKAFLLTYCRRTAFLLLPLLFPWAPTAPTSRGSWGHFWRATPKLEPPVRPILHVASSRWGIGRAGAGQCWSLGCVLEIAGQHCWAEPLAGALQLLHYPMELVVALQPPYNLPLPVR